MRGGDHKAFVNSRVVLDRLLTLSHLRYAEEVALGLHDKGAKKAGGQGTAKEGGRGAGEAVLN